MLIIPSFEREPTITKLEPRERERVRERVREEKERERKTDVTKRH